jgi:hypothetical protein
MLHIVSASTSLRHILYDHQRFALLEISALKVKSSYFLAILCYVLVQLNNITFAWEHFLMLPSVVVPANLPSVDELVCPVSS